MKIERKQIKIKDLAEGYQELGRDGIEGVVAYKSRLNTRPPYQREFIYQPKERDEVIRTVKKGFPLNTMYWAKDGDDAFSVMDGQQRTIAICRYVADQSYAVDNLYFFNLPAEEKAKIENYDLDVYICQGTPSEILEWFRVINIAGKPLTLQELRNTAYTGKWLADAKLHFSKPNNAAVGLGGDYISGKAIRQEILELALKWIAPYVGADSIEDYMALHQHDDNANELWNYFRDVIHWVKKTFPHYRKEMKGLDWGFMYNEFKDAELNPEELELKIQELMLDDDVTSKRGIYHYLLSGDESDLSIRAFTPGQKRQGYEACGGTCARCGKHFSIDEMEADHVTPWREGGTTTIDNLQMLCKRCNRIKGAS